MPDKHRVNQVYLDRKIYFALLTQGAHDDGETLRSMTQKIAGCPLVAQPGLEWQYSNATDVLGCLVEVISRQSLPEFLRDNILRPLKMSDTDFFVPESKRNRFAACYTVPQKDPRTLAEDGFADNVTYQRLPNDELFYQAPSVPSGGGGLVGTGPDYARFCQMLLNKGELGGTRILGRKSVEFMLTNHLHGDLGDYGKPTFLNNNRLGIGFGLGFAIVVNPVKYGANVSVGECSWGGMASTAFWIDPKEELACILMTQLVPSSTYAFRREIRALINSALI